MGTLPAISAAGVDILTAKMAAGKVYSFDVPITPLPFTPAAGVLASRVAFTAGVARLYAYLSNAFQEGRIRGVRLQARTLASASTTAPRASGFLKLWLDETILTTAAPTYTDAFSRATVEVPLDPTVKPDARKELQWVASDVEDLDWLPIATLSTQPSFSLAAFAGTGYTPSATGGTGTAAGDSTAVVITGAMRVEFRNLKLA